MKNLEPHGLAGDVSEALGCSGDERQVVDAEIERRSRRCGGQTVDLKLDVDQLGGVKHGDGAGKRRDACQNGQSAKDLLA